MSLISAQVQFLNDRLALVHIPLDIYPYFLQPILQLMFHEVSPIDGHQTDDANDDQPAFLNLSITPVECSVMCPRHLADRYFAPLVEQFGKVNAFPRNCVSISEDDYIAMQVYGEGLDAGQRVLELTSPLAMAGISIFFISTYFSDYIVVPLRSKAQVIRALEKRGFQFETSTDAFVNGNHIHSNSNGFGLGSPRSPTSQNSPPPTPPPSTLEELQTRTFCSLRKHHIVPSVDKSLRLVQCAAHHRYSSNSSSTSILRPALTTALLVDNPRFLSLTLTATDPAASLLLEKRLLPRFSDDPSSLVDPEGETSVLLGSKEDVLVPITLDLRDLPLEATGIVCGVAGRLAAATHAQKAHAINFPSYPEDMAQSFVSSNSFYERQSSSSDLMTSSHHLEPDLDTSLDAVEISFLSTARAGTVIVGEPELDRAVDALEGEIREPEPF